MEQPNQCNGQAEAVLRLQPDSSISIAYHSLYGPHNDLILLEVDDKILPDVIHQRVTLRGQPNEDAVLCTEAKTYALKFVGTSNSVFLVPPSNDQSYLHENSQDCGAKNDERQVATVIKMAPGHMELVEVAPRLDKLRLLLAENPYTSEDDIVMDDMDEMQVRKPVSYKWEDLVNEIQASDEELRYGLNALSAVEINGYWRIVDGKYMDMILRMLLSNSVLSSWSLNALNEGEVVAVLESDGFPGKLVEHCLHVYGTKVDGDADSSIWKLDEKRLCVHFARQILKEGKKKLDTFMAEWTRKVPDGFVASFDMLEGEVVTEKFGVETWVHPFSVSSLPSNPPERFSALFKERSKWEWKDLEPYIRDLRVPGLSAEGLLLKYTRRTQQTLDADPIFSMR